MGSAGRARNTRSCSRSRSGSWRRTRCCNRTLATERCGPVDERRPPRWLALSFAALLVAACRRTAPPVQPAGPAPIDHHATAETGALFANLRRLARQHVLFGHQDDLAYGVGWSNEPGRSDVKETAGSYPAVYGGDAGGLEQDAAANLDGVAFERQRAWIAEGFARGGVVTLSWHMRNPVTGGNAWDTTGAVAAISPGGLQHERYVQWLDRFAEYVKSLRAPLARRAGDVLVPVVFRPFHETSGGWFCWLAARPIRWGGASPGRWCGATRRLSGSIATTSSRPTPARRAWRTSCASARTPSSSSRTSCPTCIRSRHRSYLAA